MFKWFWTIFSLGAPDIWCEVSWNEICGQNNVIMIAVKLLWANFERLEFQLV